MLIFALFLSAQPVLGQMFDSIYDQFIINISSEPASVPKGSTATLVVKIDIPVGFTLTDDEDVFGITPAAAKGLSFGKLTKPPYFETDEDGMGHWTGVVTFKIPFSVAADASVGERQLDVNFLLQACIEATGQCKLPTRVKQKAKINIVEASAQSSDTGAEDSAVENAGTGDDHAGPTAASIDESAGSEQESRDSEGAGEVAGVPESTLDESLSTWLQDAIDNGYLWLAFVIVFGAGVLTSLTPCVYPMIPITIAYVSGRAQGKKRNGFFISLALVLGIVITYSALGVFAALAGQTFGAITQNLYVQAFILVVLMTMGFSMLGAFEIALPATVQQKIGVRKQGYIGALFIGLTLGFVAAPCVAPVLIPILALIATAGDILLGTLLMAVYALGMGVLFVLLGTFANFVLPKSGEWMAWLKKVFAFVLFLMAIYFAQDLLKTIPIHENLVELTTGAVLVLFGVVVGAFYRLETDSGWWRIIGKSAGILLLAAGLILFSFGLLEPMLPSFAAGVDVRGTGQSPNWIMNLEAGLKQAEAEKKPVIIDFWADYCTFCKDLDKNTFSDPRVISELQRFVAIKIDGSDLDDPEYNSAVARYDIKGLPTVIFKNSRGEIVRTINSFQKADVVLSYLKSIE